MAEKLDRLGTDSQLGKVLFELLGEIATSAVRKANAANEKDSESTWQEKEISPTCKSAPVSPREHVPTPRLCKSDDEREKGQLFDDCDRVDPSLGRPRYQWQVPLSSGTYEKDPRKSTAERKDLYSVYVGHLPPDITEDELVDLFKDIGEVIDAFVFPNSRTYTYGFVRFMTLEEAKDAVREKNLKVLGNMQIHVDLSVDTRGKIQDKDDDEDCGQLLHKDYPRVVRQSVGEHNEKMVAAKIKRSLHNLQGNSSALLGDASPEEFFEKVRIILKMLINYPMTLTNASADEGGDLSQIRKETTCSVSSDVKGLSLSRHIPSLPVTSKSSTLKIDKLTTLENKSTVSVKNIGNSAGHYPERFPPLPVEHVVAEECPLSKELNSSLLNRARDMLGHGAPEPSVSPTDQSLSRNLLSGLPRAPPSHPSSSRGQAERKLVETDDTRSSLTPQHAENSGVDSTSHLLTQKMSGQFNNETYSEDSEKEDSSLITCNQPLVTLPPRADYEYHSNYFYSLPDTSLTQASPKSGSSFFLDAQNEIIGDSYNAKEHDNFANKYNFLNTVETVAKNEPAKVPFSKSFQFPPSPFTVTSQDLSWKMDQSAANDRVQVLGSTSLARTNPCSSLGDESGLSVNLPGNSAGSSFDSSVDLSSRYKTHAQTVELSKTTTTKTKDKISHLKACAQEQDRQSQSPELPSTAGNHGLYCFPGKTNLTNSYLDTSLLSAYAGTPVEKDVTSLPLLCPSTLSNDRGSTGKIKTACDEDYSVRKSPGRLKCTLAPSFTQHLPKQNTKDVTLERKPTIPSLARIDVGTLETSSARPVGKGEAPFVDCKTTKDGGVLLEDSATVNVSKGSCSKFCLDMSTDDLKFNYKCSIKKSSIKNSANGNAVLDLCCKDRDMETIELKAYLKQQCSRLEELEKVFNHYAQAKQENSRKRYVNEPCFELDAQIHDAEILLQKKNEVWSSRASEQELAYEREKIQSVDNVNLLQQLALEMEKEHLKNELAVTELRCNIFQLKIKRFQENI